MIRILALLLALTIGAPASVWAGSNLPATVELLGMGCCPTQSAHKAEHQDAQLEKACCCSPSPAATAIAISQLGPPSQTTLFTPATAQELCDLVVVRAARLTPTPFVAQARPPPRSLLQQHTSLVI